MDDTIYIHKLPYKERTNLCRILDTNDKWVQLAKSMGYDELTITSLRREFVRDRSPTDQLLSLWSKHNHRVGELFILFVRIKELECMEIIKGFVPAVFHRFMRAARTDNVQIDRDVKINNNFVPDCKIASANFNNVEKLDNDKKLNVFLSPTDNTVSREDNNAGYHEKNAKPRSPNAGARVTSALSARSDICYSAEALPDILYEDLQKSTDNWNRTNVLGKGGFGTVFKGTWKCTKVAIKRIEEKGSSAPVQQMITEVNSLNAYRHDNILPLYGFSFNGPHNCLIYQYMSGGSLEYRIHRASDRRLLSWEARLKIAIGSARGIQFLHTTTQEPLIHGDIKSANILLDENDTARIGDFGMARKGPIGRTHLTITHKQGTKAYLPDEYLRWSKLSTKVDTYSFGIVLYELATGLPPISVKRRPQLLKDLIEKHDGDVMLLKDKKPQSLDEHFLGLLEIGRLCTPLSPRERPEMVEVLIKLEKICSENKNG